MIKQQIDWTQIRTVFLDMDGTLLDLHFDDYFWREHVPQRYAERFKLDLNTAKSELYKRYRRIEGTIEWYCLDFWSRELGLDIPVLKEEVDHLIQVHPFVVEFLDAVRAAKKRAVLVTNAHGKSLSLKMNRTSLGRHLDGVVCAHDLGVPKEQVAFWKKLKSIEPFTSSTTLLIDDSIPVLESARTYGIRFLLTVIRPNTKKPIREIEGFPALRSFRDILPD